MWVDDPYSRDYMVSRPFPEEWDAHLRRNVAHYPLLSDDEKKRLQPTTMVLVAQKYWEGCGGLEITEEMKVTIAAQAALMLLGIEHACFSRVLSILVYPSGFLIPGGPWM